MTIYTIIGYRPNGWYRDDRSSAELEINPFETIEEVINELFKYKVRNKEDNDHPEINYWETTILINGEDFDFWCDNHWTTDTIYTDTEFFKIEQASEERFLEWAKGENDRKEQARLEKIAKEEALQKGAAKRQVAQEKALLATLREKYPNG